MGRVSRRLFGNSCHRVVGFLGSCQRCRICYSLLLAALSRFKKKEVPHYGYYASGFERVR
jgi:hypothetical protein